MSNRGGVRLGAGRPKSEETKLVRVPVGAESLVREAIHAYKLHDDNVFLLDGPELFMIRQYLKRKNVSWGGASPFSTDSELSTEDILSFIGDELATCLARKGVIKS